jgi:hypothetical protein
MTSEQIGLIKNYLTERKENQFSQDILKKLNRVKTIGEQAYIINKCINPKILNKIIYNKE